MQDIRRSPYGEDPHISGRSGRSYRACAPLFPVPLDEGINVSRERLVERKPVVAGIEQEFCQIPGIIPSVTGLLKIDERNFAFLLHQKVLWFRIPKGCFESMSIRHEPACLICSFPLSLSSL